MRLKSGSKQTGFLNEWQNGGSEKARAQHEQDVLLQMEIDAAKRADKAARAGHNY
jgi:hypothetical protein